MRIRNKISLPSILIDIPFSNGLNNVLNYKTLHKILYIMIYNKNIKQISFETYLIMLITSNRYE